MIADPRDESNPNARIPSFSNPDVGSGSRNLRAPEVRFPPIRALLVGGKCYTSVLEWIMDIINDPDADIEVKSRLAVAALPFQHPRIESVPIDGGKKERKAKAAAAIQERPSPFAAPAAPRLVA